MDVFTDVDLLFEVLDAAARRVPVYILLDEMNSQLFLDTAAKCRVNLNYVEVSKLKTYPAHNSHPQRGSSGDALGNKNLRKGKSGPENGEIYTRSQETWHSIGLKARSTLIKRVAYPLCMQTEQRVLEYKNGGRRDIKRVRGKKRGSGINSLVWFAVPKGENSFWPNLLLPHGDVFQRTREREIPLGGLHGGAEWQLQVRSPVMLMAQCH